MLSPPSLSCVSHSHLACEIALSSQGLFNTPRSLFFFSALPLPPPPSVSLNSNWLNNESITIYLACSKQMGTAAFSLALLLRFHWLYAFKFSLNATQTKDMVIDFQSKAAHQKRLPVKLQGLKKLSLDIYFFLILKKIFGQCAVACKKDTAYMRCWYFLHVFIFLIF